MPYIFYVAFNCEKNKIYYTKMKKQYLRSRISQVVVRWPVLRQARGSNLGPAIHATALRKFQRISVNGMAKFIL
jgi:hypothetical protein